MTSSSETSRTIEEEIVQSISEWPVTGANELQLSSDIDKITYPQSVSSFFLRNVRPKSKKVQESIKPSIPQTPEENELLVDVALAKWWRKECSKCVDTTSIPESKNPNTVINFVAGTVPGCEFIQNGIKRLRDKVANGSRGSDVHSALASYYEKIGSLSPAKMHLEAALDKAPENKELKWRLRRLLKLIQFREQREKVLHEINFSSDSQLTMPAPNQIQRISADNLTFKSFFEDFALKSVPVILEDLVDHMTTVPWTLQHILDVAGECQVNLKKRIQSSVEWAQLEPSNTMTIKEYIKTIQEGANHDALYLFDWSIPSNCPELAQEIVIPKFFAGDFLQRTTDGTLYKDSWPSLFIASKGLTSELHVDTFGSSFWMALFEGKKRWMFYNKTDLFKLYPVYGSPWSTDPGFLVDPNNPDLTEFPLMSLTQPVECILEAGEVLFVPSGCPHRVENLEQSLAISANFVDLSNVDLVREELETSGLLDDRSEELFQQLNNRDFPSDMDFDIGHLPWEKFKNWSKKDNKNNVISYSEIKEKLS